MPTSQDSERLDARARAILKPLLLAQGRDPEGFTYAEYSVALEQATSELGPPPTTEDPLTALSEAVHERALKRLGTDTYTAEQYLSAVSAAEEDLGARDDETIVDPEYERQVLATVAELDRQVRERHERFLRKMAVEEPMRLREIADSCPDVARYLIEYGITV